MTAWKKVKLGEVIDTLKGAAFKSSLYVSEGVPVVRVSDFTQDSISDENLFYYSKENALGFEKYRLKHWDILIQTVGSWQHNPASIVGKVVRVPKELASALLNQNIVKVIVDENNDNKFIYYRLKDESFKFYNLGCAQGAANQASITLEAIRKFEFNLPPLTIQKRIAEILSAYDDLIENNLKRIKLLEELAQRTYEEWFVKFRVEGEQLPIDEITGLPVRWERKKIKDVLVLQYGKALKADERSGGEIDVYGSSGIVGKHSSRLVDAPGIVVGRKGNVGATYWADNDFYPIDTVYYVESTFSLYYLFQNLKRQNFINSDAAVPGLNRNAAYMLDIIVPNQELLDRYTAQVAPIFTHTKQLRMQIELLKESRDILLPRLMNGSINVNLKE